MRIRLSAAVLTAAMLLGAAGVAHAQQISLTGTVLRQGPSGMQASADAGDRVYVFSKQTGWVGPSVTDSSGQFYFYDLPRDTYLLRIYVGDTQAWNQDIQTPANVAPIVLANY